MGFLSLFSTDLLTVLVNLLEVLWCGAGIDPTPSWICLIECIYDFVNIIYNDDLDSSAFNVIKFHPEVVVNLYLVDSHFS